MALILIIDDSSYQRRLVRKYMEAQGHQTIEADNGHVGLEMAASHRPDCILLDLIMPETSGFELLEKLQQQGSKIPVVVITADVQTSTHKQCLALGARAIINKPVDSEQLYQTINHILGSPEEGEA
ncbi:MAG: response regulator [Anaerolineae bacterium]|nr:response regulator [Anaerolineae bacterium]